MKKTGLMSALDAAKPAPAPSAGGKRGKKSDPRFRQISVLVEKNAYLEAKRRLIGTDMDASDLMNSLLVNWLKGK